MPQSEGRRRLLLLAVAVTSLYACLRFFRPSHSHLSREPIRKYQRRIVAIGDLHGDLPNTLKVMKMAGVIDDNNDWNPKAVDFLVQTGDIVDRGDDTIPIYRLMEKLRWQAEAAGGMVLSCFGNHEIMNAMGDWRYVPLTEIKTFGGVKARQEAMSTGWLGSAWRRNYTITHRLPLHPSLGAPDQDFHLDKVKGDDMLSHAALSFVHGGLASSFPYLTPYPSAINALGDSLLHKLQSRNPQPPPHPPNPYPGLPPTATVAEKYLYGSDGPLWYRGWAMDEDEGEVCNKADDVLKRTGVRRLIMGHTPTFTNIVSRCKGKIIIIDTGISHAYGGVLSALSITYTLDPVNGQPDVWKETEEVVAVYEHSRTVIAVDSRELKGDYSAHGS